VDRQPQASAGNGAGGPRPQVAAAGTATRPRDARQLRLGQSFAQVVAVLMRDRNFRQMRLADLEWLVLPPLMAGQFRLAQMPALQRGTAGSTQPGVQGSTLASDKGKDGGDGGMLVPVAVALWARVSAVIDRQLSENLDKVVRLGAGDWASGEHVWLMAVAGDRRIVPKLLEQLAKDEFKGQRVKMRVRGPNNTVVVRTLGQSASV
jgi:hemolysin-activating ACP:hemolysin acyltransferase